MSGYASEAVIPASRQRRQTGGLIYLKLRTFNQDFLFPSLYMIATHREARDMHDFRSVIAPAFLALAAWMAMVNPSQADTGTVRVLFGAAGVSWALVMVRAR